MENATKALVMAGGILIAVMIIGAVIYGFNYYGVFDKTKEDTLEVQQLAKFNQKYESYDRNNIPGVDIISLINMALENNLINADLGDNYKITIKFTLKTSISNIYIANTVYTQKDYKNKKNLLENATDISNFRDFKNRKFKSIEREIVYNSETGRISQLYFEQI